MSAFQPNDLLAALQAIEGKIRDQDGDDESRSVEIKAGHLFRFVGEQPFTRVKGFPILVVDFSGRAYWLRNEHLEVLPTVELWDSFEEGDGIDCYRMVLDESHTLYVYDDGTVQLYNDDTLDSIERKFGDREMLALGRVQMWRILRSYEYRHAFFAECYAAWQRGVRVSTQNRNKP